MILCMNWSDPTILGGIIGIIGSILGAIIGACFTVLLTWLFSRGKIKFLILDNDLKITNGIINGVETYRHVNEWGDQILEGVEIKFQCLITNGKKDNYSFSHLEIIVKNKKNKFNKLYLLKDTNKHSNSYVLDEHSSMTISLQFREIGRDFYSNYKNSKFYIKYIDCKGKESTKRIYLKLENPQIVNGL